MRSMMLGAALLLVACDGSSKAAAAKALEGIVPGEEREMGDGVFFLMHRIQATAPLGDGWQKATSTQGGFSVEVPLPFNDLRIRAQTADHVEMRTHTVGGKTPGQLSFSASCMVRRDGKVLTPIADRIEALGTPVKAYQRSVELDGAVCALIVEAQGADPLPAEGERLRFLGSLKRTGPPLW